MYENRREIMQDVFLTYLPARKFKTSRLTVNLIAGLDRVSASANALLPAVLSRGTARYPDMEQLSAAMDSLYGATVDSIVPRRESASASALPPPSSTMPSRPTA